MAPVVYDLWQKRLNFDPNIADLGFILSAGHASMLLYALLHLTKTKAVNAEYETLGRPSVTHDDIKSFRQLGSACPAHPEYHLTSGVEATTGPLGGGYRGRRAWAWQSPSAGSVPISTVLNSTWWTGAVTRTAATVA